MKIRFYCDSGANIHSLNKSDWIDVEEIGFTEEEWGELTEQDKYKIAHEEAWSMGLDVWWEEK